MTKRRPIVAKLGDAIVAMVNGDDFRERLREIELPLEFEARRTYGESGVDMLKGCGKLDVAVLPNSMSGGLGTRESINYVPSQDVCIRYRFGQGDQQQTGELDIEKVDELSMLAEEIHRWLLARYAESDDDAFNAVPSEAEFRTIYIRQHLQDWRQFTSVVQIPYDVEEEFDNK